MSAAQGNIRPSVSKQLKWCMYVQEAHTSDESGRTKSWKTLDADLDEPRLAKKSSPCLQAVSDVSPDITNIVHQEHIIQTSGSPVNIEKKMNDPPPPPREATSPRDELMDLVTSVTANIIRNVTCAPLEGISGATLGSIPCARDGATLTRASGGLLILFGGRFQTQESLVIPTKVSHVKHAKSVVRYHVDPQVHVFHVLERRWTLLPTFAGPRPEARWDHSAVYVEPHLFISGGRGAQGQALGDFWCLETPTPGRKSWHWSALETFACCSMRARFWHSMVRSGDSSQILIFGGRDDEERVRADVHVFEVELGLKTRHRLKPQNTKIRVSSSAWSSPAISGTGPPPSIGARILTLDVPNTYLCIGGQDPQSLSCRQSRVELFVLNLNDQIWTKIVPATYIHGVQAPECRLGAHVFREQEIVYVFGGSSMSLHHARFRDTSTRTSTSTRPGAIYRFDLKHLIWTRERLVDFPSLRCNFSALEPVENNEELLSFYALACDPTEPLVDRVYSFSFETS